MGFITSDCRHIPKYGLRVQSTAQRRSVYSPKVLYCPDTRHIKKAQKIRKSDGCGVRVVRVDYPVHRNVCLAAGECKSEYLCRLVAAQILTNYVDARSGGTGARMNNIDRDRAL